MGVFLLVCRVLVRRVYSMRLFVFVLRVYNDDVAVAPDVDCEMGVGNQGWGLTLKLGVGAYIKTRGGWWRGLVMFVYSTAFLEQRGGEKKNPWSVIRPSLMSS